jgi:hypothetical protein
MRASQNASGGSSQLSMNLHQTEAGVFEAESPSMPWLEKVVAPTQSEAVQKLRQAYQDWILNGCRQGNHPSTL